MSSLQSGINDQKPSLFGKLPAQQGAHKNPHSDNDKNYSRNSSSPPSFRRLCGTFWQLQRTGIPDIFCPYLTLSMRSTHSSCWPWRATISVHLGEALPRISTVSNASGSFVSKEEKLRAPGLEHQRSCAKH